VTFSSWINFGRPAPPGRGSAAGRKCSAPPYYSQRAVFACLWALFPFLMYYIVCSSCKVLSISTNLLNSYMTATKTPSIFTAFVVTNVAYIWDICIVYLLLLMLIVYLNHCQRNVDFRVSEMQQWLVVFRGRQMWVVYRALLFGLYFTVRKFFFVSAIYQRIKIDRLIRSNSDYSRDEV